MFTGSLENVANAVGGVLIQGDRTQPVRGVFTDTRAPAQGGLFIAVRGERFDGHRFVGNARLGGAAAVLVERLEASGDLEEDPGCGVILVPDTRKAYLKLAAAHRLKLDHVRWFGITGSAGKTTVKEMLASILGSGAGWKVHRAEKSFNNEIGVPATILAADVTHRAAVLELGTNHHGEIARLAEVARPHIAVITLAGPVHVEFLGSVRGVAEEKSHILDFQGPGDTAVLNADDAHLDLWMQRAKGLTITFGLSKRAMVRAEAIEDRPGRGAHFYLGMGSRAVEVQLRVYGRHNVLNALAAAAAALAARVSLDAVAAGLNAYRGAERRFQIRDLLGVRVIDDAYNANPLSFRAALEAMSNFAGCRLFIVAGDMLELGADAERFHRELGEQFARVGPHELLTVGPLARLAGEEALRGGLPAGAWAHCATPEEAAECLRPQLTAGDVVLVKGSHGVGLDRCIARLNERAALAAGA